MDHNKEPIHSIPKILKNAQLNGYEISDRDLISLSKNDKLLISKLASDRDLEIVTDINVDLTYRNSVRRRQQINHAVAQIKTADLMGVRRTRIILGGQLLSLQKILERRSQPNHTPNNHSRVAKAPSRLLPSLFNVISHLTHKIRKNTKARVWHRETKIELAIEALNKIMPIAERFGIRIGIENHWGISSRPDWIMEVVESVGSPYLGTCPDFGNWPKDVSAYDGVATMSGKAFIAHIKTINPRGNVSKQFNSIKKNIDILLKQSFSGPFTLEHEGIAYPWHCISETAKLLRQNFN